MFVVVLEEGGNERQDHREAEQVHQQEKKHVSQCGVRTGATGGGGGGVGGRAPRGRRGSPTISPILFGSDATTEFRRRLLAHCFLLLGSVLL